MLSLAISALAFNAAAPPRLHGTTVARRSLPPCAQSDGDTLLDKAQTSLRLFQESQAAGLGFKQAVADAIAGEYDSDAVTTEVKELASSAPLVLFTWESSPACKKALKYLEASGVTPKVVRLDDPWDEGNPRRAALGRITGKSSVPSCWIGGEYVGGCDDGPSDTAPGLVTLAFQGNLQAKLRAAGAMPAASSEAE